MTEHILKMVKTPNPQAIQRYVKNHLPNDPISLERIYKELLTYQFKAQNQKISKQPKKTLSVKSFKTRQSLSRNKPRGDHNQVKKTENLIKMLRQKGLKAEGDCQEAGLALFATQRQRLVKPLLTNSKLLKSQTAQIDRVINRYTINNEFYGHEVKNEAIIDPQMEEFFKRRQSVLQSIKNQNNTVSLNRKFSYVEPKLYQTASLRQSFQKIPITQVAPNVQSHISSVQALMSICQEELSLQKYKQVHPNMNIFAGLDIASKDESQAEPGLQDSESLRKRISNEQYQRYTNSYMEMMNKKTKASNKCRLSKYDKDLLRDAKKMRRIIDFDNK